MLPTFFHMFQRIQRRRRIAHARTARPAFAGVLPRLGALHVVLPEGPRLALHRPHGIDRAAGLALLVAREEAAIIIGLLRERIALADLPHVGGGERLKIELQVSGDALHVTDGQPHIPRPAAAAVAALRAGKPQPLGVPHLVIENRLHL